MFDYLLLWVSRFLFARHSAYSYEDLPSDKFGAIFGGLHFDPKSELTLSQQIEEFINKLKSDKPENAPNFNLLPKSDADYMNKFNVWRKRGLGPRNRFDEIKAGPRVVPINKTTNPIYTK